MYRNVKIAVLAALLVAAIAGSTGLAAGKGTKMGAVKVALSEIQGGGKVGFVVLNTTPNGMLVVNIQVKDGEPDTPFDVTATVDGLAELAGSLTTNAKGKGHLNCKVALDESAYQDDSIDVEIVLTPTIEAYTSGYTTGTVTVRLKPLRGDDTPDGDEGA